ncbi:MAG: hypothetical protein C0407_10105 [Desulfobacca sp.]|nr:hypothetical protein [Desulfobacca sp.]
MKIGIGPRVQGKRVKGFGFFLNLTPWPLSRYFRIRGKNMNKGYWFGLVVALSLSFVLSPLAQEGVLWIGKFSGGQTADNTPTGWILEEKFGTPDLKIEKSEDHFFVRFKANNSSFGIKKEKEFDIKDTPYLNWKWKVTALPERGDFLKKETDDQAAQIYVFFPRFPAKLNTEIVGYLWESNPKNLRKEGESPAWSKSKVIVLQAGPKNLNQWVQEKRNVYEDYKRLFKKEPPKAGGVTLYSNSQHTQGKTESYFAEIFFSKK